MNALLDLSVSELRTLADALSMGRLSAPFSEISIRRYCASGNVDDLIGALNTLDGAGAATEAIAMMLRLLADSKGKGNVPGDVVDLVWTGPELPEAPSRDTGAVVRELFTTAREHVLVAGYAVYQGKEVFRALAHRMDECPELQVEMYLDIQRGYNETTIAEDLVQRFAHRFRTEQWPGKRLPEIYYDPRALEMDKKKKAALHAKCVVVDRQTAFVSSANFTEAAQQRNIEVGTLIKSPDYAARVVHHFQALAAAGLLIPVPGS